MRHLKIPVILLSFLVTANCCAQSIRNFTIKTKDDGLVSSNARSAIITQDSIISITCPDPGCEVYRKAFTNKEKALILNAVKKINADTLKESYAHFERGDDAGEYTFIFNIDGKTSKCFIYAFKIEPLLDLVDEINKMIPQKYALGYNHDMLKWVDRYR